MKEDFSDFFERLLGENSPFGIPIKPMTSRVQHKRLRGDDICLEKLIEVRAIRVTFPEDQVTAVYEGTKNQIFEYNSPTDGSSRKVCLSYDGKHCRIEIVK